MDPETALDVAEQGAALLLLDVPQYTLFGIDTQVYTVGPTFKGVKMIPPGPHFVFYSSCSRYGKEFSPVIGFFVNAGPSEVIVRKWVHQEERLVKVYEEEEDRFSQAVKSLEFERQLGPYNLDQYGEWKSLSNYVTKNVIDRIEPIGGEITIESESGITERSPKTVMEKALEEQLRNSKCSSSASADKSKKRGCYYTSIPHVIKRRGMSRAELTSLNIDKTEQLDRILMKDYEGSEDLLIGELQFAFIAFLMGQSLESFFQWKSLVSLLLCCTKAPFHTRTQLFTKFIKVLYYQLKYGLQKDRAENNGAWVGVSTLLDESWFSFDSFLYRLLKDFFLLVQDASVVDGDLLTWVRKLREPLENSLGWEFQQNSAVDGMYFDEDDEYAPVVVMLDDASYNGESQADSSTRK